jgi:L-iditol 2-dehydrogenase
VVLKLRSGDDRLEAELRMGRSASEHNKRAMEYISTGQVPVKELITRHVSLDNVLDVFDIVASGEAIKVTVEPK